MLSAVLKPLALAVLAAFAASASTAWSGPSYRAYAEGMVRSLPNGAALRPDLENYLDALASSARMSRSRPPLAASELLRTAARAQAIEMLKGNFVGHASAGGYSFKARFAAFAEPEVHGSYGENAARDTRPGGVGRAKAARIFRQWLDSGAHRRNLMNRTYGHVSTGAVAMGNQLYAVQIFFEKCAPELPPPVDGSCEKPGDGQPRIGESGVITGFGGLE